MNNPYVLQKSQNKQPEVRNDEESTTVIYGQYRRRNTKAVKYGTTTRNIRKQPILSGLGECEMQRSNCQS